MHAFLNLKLVVISCSCRRLVAKKFPALDTNWPLGNFPRLGPLAYFPAHLTDHVI